MPIAYEVLRAEDLLRRAEETEATAKLVSYGLDKTRLQERADRLREQARALLGEDRTWGERSER